MSEKTESQLLVEFMDGLSNAIGASSQIIHHHRDPRWMGLREMLSKVKDMVMTVAVNPITSAKIKVE